MTTKIDLLDNWLSIKKGLASLYLQGIKDDINSAGFSNIGEDLLSDLRKKDSTNELIKFLRGEEFYSFSFVFVSPGITILKTDIVRSVPLFYTFSDNQVYISDQNNPEDDHTLDKDSIIEMVELGHVLGDRTVYKNVFGAQAAEIIIFNNGSIKKDRFFSYDTGRIGKNSNQLSIKENAFKLNHILHQIFQEIIESIPKEAKVIVPLSGGHDSRIIVNYLYKLGFKNVLCYTYGIPNNMQAQISRRVADALGYEWHFIEYTDEKWEELHKNGDFDKYIDFAFNGVSNPHMQDFLAVYELKKKGIINPEDVFIPGHGLDILSEVVDHSKYDEDVINAAVKCFSRSSEIPNDIVAVLHEGYKRIFDSTVPSKKGFIDHLYWQERAAKFTVNSLRVYNFYGYAARVPFWDIRLINYWLDIDLKLKQSRKFLFDLEKESLLTPALRETPYASLRKSIKERKKNIKDYIPGFFKILYLRISKRKQPQSEGLNLIYNKKAKSVRELIGPTDQWPEEIIDSIGMDLKRYPFQINHHFLTRLYTVSKLFKSQSTHN